MIRAFTLLTVLTAAALLASLTMGAADLSVGTVISVLTGSSDAAARVIVLDLRLPRAVLAILVGGALALAGAVLQALLRNPLAEPYVLGVSGGAAVGAIGSMFLGLAVRADWIMTVAAFGGAIVAIVLVFQIAARVGQALDTRVLLLAGVVVGAFFNAVVLLMITLSDIESFRSAVFWLMGSLTGASWHEVVLSGLYIIPAAIVLIALARTFNLLALGEETAAYLGARVERVKVIAYVVASLLVATGVAACGVIGFVGLIVPHALRLAFGADHRIVLPGSMLAGGAFLLITDTAARTIVTGAELPVGVITALVGVPLFVVLLVRGSR